MQALPCRGLQPASNEAAARAHTLQGMMAVKPALTGTWPAALKLSPAAVKAAEVRLETASGDSAPRKCLTMYSYSLLHRWAAVRLGVCGPELRMSLLAAALLGPAGAAWADASALSDSRSLTAQTETGLASSSPGVATSQAGLGRQGLGRDGRVVSSIMSPLGVAHTSCQQGCCVVAPYWVAALRAHGCGQVKARRKGSALCPGVGYQACSARSGERAGAAATAAAAAAAATMAMKLHHTACAGMRGWQVARELAVT